MVDLSLAPLDALAASLRDLDEVRTASTDPADLTALPGVFLRFTGFTDRTFGGDYETVTADLVIVVDNTSHARSRDQLLAVAGVVVDLLDGLDVAVGDVTPQPTVIPDSPQNILPGLVIPITL